MRNCDALADDWNATPGWSASTLVELDERYVAVIVDPSRDVGGRWRDELEPLEIDRFSEWGFVRDADEHRAIYDGVLGSTHYLAIGWAPTGHVLSVCRFMRTSPRLAVPLIAAIDSGTMRLDHFAALVDARRVAGVAVEATIVTVRGPCRPADAPSPTDVCHGLFMAVAWTFGCRWILSAVDPGALAHGHRRARAGHLIREVGTGTDTTGLETAAISLSVDEVVAALEADPACVTSVAMAACRRLSVEHLAARGGRSTQLKAPLRLPPTSSSPGRPLATR